MPGVVRHAIRVRGTVQGVGFRPTVYRIAISNGLAGSVRNDADGVWIEIEGEPETAERFPEQLRAEAPALARIDSVEVTPLAPVGEHDFKVVASDRQAAGTARIPADSATCEACLAELFDPTDRRHRYPFINCTDCGPRYTIVREVPYDRACTTMSAFALCPECRGEYENPASRRFHAEPNACPRCGPRLTFTVGGEPGPTGEEALRAALLELRAGRIVAVKGLGGFFLAVDPTNEHAVARLRLRKRRPHKPFALMARDLGVVEAIARVGEVERALLRSKASPIVLLRRAENGAGEHGPRVAPSVAPGLRELGVMLPYTPLHHLLLAELPLLVMTSGNLSEEPIARENAEALERLRGVADAFLLHDREIHARADDSVVRVIGGVGQPVRRSRGYVPEALPLPVEGPPLLAVGGELKNALCFTRAGEAHLSPHIGDLETPETFAFFREVIERYARLLSVEPRAVAHDLHPDYHATRWALASGLRRVAVQHHHAHIASCLAEHGKVGPVIGVAFDGTGCGPGGELWGGEILIADLGGFERFLHLRPIALAGGEAAIREPWRLALAALLDAGVPPEGLVPIAPARLTAVRQLIEKGVGAPRATGAGRWFDAVSALCRVRDEISYEGQAAIELEAMSSDEVGRLYPFAVEPPAIDLRPMVRGIAADLRECVPMALIAARFHETLAVIVLEAARRAREARGLTQVALSGGCFQNRILLERSAALLAEDGFEVLTHRQVPANDGGLALGQAAVASFRLAKEAADVPRHSG